MRWLIFLIGLHTILVCQGAPLASNSLTQVVSESKTHYKLDNFKMVMPHVLYRGGSSGARSPMTTEATQTLCKDGFSKAVYLYSKNWKYNKPLIVKCSAGQLIYDRERWDHPTEVHQILKNIHAIIINRRGPMYIHCWYGVHASGYVAAVALRQFCGLSTGQAIKYWNDNVPKRIQYKKVQTMIQAFKPYPDLMITPEQQARVCLF